MTLSSYRSDIDGLRAVAVLAVVLHHLSASLVPGGYVGVDVFFVISGYLITSIISREMAEGQFTFICFYERRARRIFPALFVVLAVTLVVGYFLLLPSDYVFAMRATLGTLFFSSNFMFWQELQGGYFAPDAKLNPLLHTWSLAVEEQFYLLFPIVLLVCYRYMRKYIGWVLLSCFLLSLIGAALLVNRKVGMVFFLSPYRAWELLAGAILALGVVPSVRSRALCESLVAGGLLAIVGACFVYDDKTTFPGFSALLPVLGAASIIHAGGSGLTLTGRLLQWRPIAYVGLISYSLYLWHWPVIVFTQYANGMDPLAPYLPILFVMSLLLGSLSYHFIEQPFRRGRRFTTRKVVFSSTAVFASLLIVVSVTGLLKNGFEGRLDTTVVQLDKASSPVIPYVQCDGRISNAWCLLGRSEGELSTLLWGDSHLLAWAPALQEILVRKNQRAAFAMLSGCPPLFGVERTVIPLCAGANTAVKNYLLARPEIKTIVMSARWGPYFSEEGMLTEMRGNTLVKGTVAAQHALITTVQWLRDHGKTVILIGPVPGYENNVPRTLALNSVTGKDWLHSSASVQMQQNASFLTVVKTILPSATFNFLDPIQWLCKDDCQVMRGGLSLYRDSNHLSIAGALALEADLSKGFTLAPLNVGAENISF